MSTYDDDDVTELTFIDPSRVDGVMTPATGSSFIVLKSRATPRLSPKTREAFRRNAERVRAGLKPGKSKKRPKAKKAVHRSRIAQPVAVNAASGYSSEIPGSGPGEAASIEAVLTGSRSSGICAMRTASGGVCQRPSVAGGPCHHHN